MSVVWALFAPKRGLVSSSVVELSPFEESSDLSTIPYSTAHIHMHVQLYLETEEHKNRIKTGIKNG